MFAGYLISFKLNDISLIINEEKYLMSGQTSTSNCSELQCSIAYMVSEVECKHA